MRAVMPSHIVGCFRFSILCKMQWPLGGQNNPQWMQARSEAPRRVCVMLPNVLCCFQCVMQYANTGFENSSFSSGLGRIYCTACFPSFFFFTGSCGAHDEKGIFSMWRNVDISSWQWYCIVLHIRFVSISTQCCIQSARCDNIAQAKQEPPCFCSRVVLHSWGVVAPFIQ